ncbi:MAG: DNA mismatch repair protein MutS, partial [Clostridia bacterium]|nr:DNA mismatch repair protein MutS [Clostridia bacterium]
LSIAWSVAEYIANPKHLGAKTMFATHYHELIALEGLLSGIKNYSIACKKRDDKVTFLRRIVKGGTDDSFGIEVAGLAGLPKQVISRAKEILADIENKSGHAASPAPAVPHNEDAQLAISDMRGEEIVRRLESLDLQTLTPIEALNLLYELQNTAKR